MAGHRRSIAKSRRPVASGTVSPAQTTIKPRDPEVLGRLAGEVALRTFPRQQIRSWRDEIHKQVLVSSRSMNGSNFTRVSQTDLQRMVRLYDDRFFGGQIVATAASEGLRFSLSSRMTRTAGKLVTQYPQGDYNGIRQFEMVLSSTLLFQTFEDVSRPVAVAGCPCRDRVDAMQRVVEHEFVHLVEMLIWNDGNCSEARFQSIASRYFGHTDYQHDLITQRERAARRFDIRVGDHVVFFHDGHRLSGRVNRITRRATILVPNPAGEPFSDGERYVRYYVPLEQLRKVRG